jgi:hypothetical protein
MEKYRMFSFKWMDGLTRTEDFFIPALLFVTVQILARVSWIWVVSILKTFPPPLND